MKIEIADSTLNKEFEEALIKEGFLTAESIKDGSYVSGSGISASDLLEVMIAERDDPTPQD